MYFAKFILAVSFTLFQISLCLDGGISAHKRVSFSVPFDCHLCEPKFGRFAVHDTTGDVYVGSTNKLTHLDSDLNVIQNISTFEECESTSPEGVDREDCLNHNKILVIYHKEDKLISCGSLSGTCQIRNVSDISSTFHTEFTSFTPRIAASGENSTVYVIAPAGDEDKLYVGRTEPDFSLFNFAVYARLNLPDGRDRGFLGADNDLVIDNKARTDNFVVNYVDAFNHKSFTYFATNQRFDFDVGVSRNIISKLNRACHNYDNLDSYAEVVIECKGSSGVDYNLIRSVYLDTVGADLANSIGVNHTEQVLIALFSKSVDPTDFTPDNTSAICIYDMGDVEMRFRDALIACMEGRDAHYIRYLGDGFCGFDLTNFVDRIDEFNLQCNTQDQYRLPRGKIDEPITATAITELPGTLGSSIITTTEEQHTIAFIGTATGDLLKVHLTNGGDRVYETISLGSPVINDVYLDKTGEVEELTVLTEQNLYKLVVENCSFYTTCEDCIGVTAEDGDPYCGWCSLNRTCTRKSECIMPDTSTRWLFYDEAQCLEISNVAPYDSQPYTVQQEITITVEQLPDLPVGENYECFFEFGTVTESSSATKSGNDLTCMTPADSQLPTIPEGEDHTVMLLSIESSETGVKFVDTNFTFYECGTHTRCLDCASSQWDCDWCTYENICTHDSATYCTDDSDMTLIAGSQNRTRQNPSRQGPDQCAQLEQQPKEVFLPSGLARDINITVRNLPDRFTDIKIDDYTCILHIEGTTQESRGTRMNENTVQCALSQYTYEEVIQEMSVNLTLNWAWAGTNRTIDDEFGFNATLFKCEVDRPDCSRCVSNETTRPELRCGWCSDSELCAVSDHPRCGDIDSWIRETTDNEVIAKSCPAPIFTIWPSSGPIEGNTIIELTGSDLGRSFGSIQSITVAGEDCDYEDYYDNYKIGERILCRTKERNADTAGDVIVTVLGVNDARLENEANNENTTFIYRDPEITSISPEFGPQAGGTRLTIIGQNLIVGRDINIRIGTANCTFNRSSIMTDELICTTDESFVGNKDYVKISYDEAIRISKDEFEFLENPTIESFTPTDAFEAGGRQLTVLGTNLNVVQAPEVKVSDDTGKEYRQPCVAREGNATVMTCPSPTVDLPSFGRRKRQADEDEPEIDPAELEYTDFTIGFVMDGVKDLLSVGNIRYFPNPNYTEFVTSVPTPDNTITIEGTRINLASQQGDISVIIDNLTCVVTSLGREKLACTLPDEVDNCTDMQTFTVSIKQGFLNFDSIGRIDCNNTEEENPLTKEAAWVRPVIYGVAAVAFVLLVLVIVTSVIYKYRVTHAKEQTLKLLNEMEKLEDSMANKIRDAFAQLQLDLQDLTSDLEGTGMPFVTNEEYATNMLFSGLKTRPPTKDPIDLDDRKERAMTEFLKLLEDKNFLLTFIRVLDEPRSAPAPVVRERTKFACFLTTLMIVEGKLPYLTDVMMTILKGYIEEVVDDDKAFQLCQRTETVGERLLTNWVSVCLFTYLKDQAAFPLFVLYRAILLQTERGPVDIVSGKAYYSLSEYSVLTVEDLQYCAITLNVVVNEDGETKPMQATNLDTISQVKEKILDLIYRNKPYSQRPDVSIVDLEWRQGRAGRLILRDSDSTSETDEEFKKLNTLSHFKIKNQATVALVVKQNAPNGAIDPTILRRSIFVREDDDDKDDDDKDNDGLPAKTKHPRVSLYSKRQRARFTMYELSPMEEDEHLKAYHLEKPEEEAADFRQSLALAKNRLSRRISAAIKQPATTLKKIHYPQLLTAKGATQQYVDNMFDAVLDKNRVPKPIKYVFDFLEAEARAHNITDGETIHKWKSSCLPLRFWVTIINNPQYIFDIRESRSVTSSMNVVGQAFFDAFNRTDHTHSKQTGFNKLLYHRDLDGFQHKVDKYYMAVNDLPEVDTTEIEEELDMIAHQFSDIFSKMSLLQSLYHFATMNNDKLLEALDEDDVSQKARLAFRLENVATILEGETV